MAETLSFPPNRNRLRLYVALTALLFGISFGVMFSLEQLMHRDLRLIALIVATLGCLSFGYGVLYNIFRLRQPQPLLQADAEGLWWHVSVLNHGKVEWGDIIAYEVATYGLSRKFLIKVKRPEYYVEKYPGVRKLVLRNALKRYQTPIVMPVNLFEGDMLPIINQVSGYSKHFLKL